VIVKLTTVAGVGVAALCSPVNVAKAINLKGQSINIKVSPQILWLVNYFQHDV